MYNLPNLLTMSRIVAIPIIFVTAYFDAVWANWVAGVVFIIAAITDYFDGYYARKLNIVSSFGRFLDPIADKLLVATSLLILVANEDVTIYGLIPVSIILCRELLVSGLREFLAQVNINVPVTRLAKWKTGVQMTAIPMLLLGKEVFYYFTPVGEVLLWIAAILTFMTGYSYLRAGFVHMSNEDKKNQA